MFFSSNQYPAIAHLPIAERKKVVAIAVKSQNAWIGRRFGIVLAMIGVGAVALGVLAPALTNPELLVFAAVTGALFYLYMLLEINGAVLKAVEAHFAQANHHKSEGEN